MTVDEAQKIGSIVAEADDGCKACVGDLVILLNEAFPEFVWSMRNDWYGGEGDRVTVREAK